MTRRRVMLLGIAGTLAGCAFTPNRNEDGPDAPRSMPLRRPVRTAWVLSSGGPRGFTHVGVLKALDALGLAPDLIVGASVGAMVGCLRASGMGAQRVLAVDATVHLDTAPAQAARYRDADLRKKALVDADAAHADLVLKPDFGYWVNLSQEFRARAIAAGYREVLAQAVALRRLHEG